MKYLHEFTTQTACDNFMNGENYEEPFTALITENGKIAYNKESQHDYSKDYFTVKALGSGTITWNRKGMEVPSYRINGGEWTSDPQTGGGYNIPVNENDEVEFSFNPASDGNVFYQFVTANTEFEVYGNIFSLLYGDDFEGKTTFEKNITFKSLFLSSKVISAENLVLPATTLIASAYTSMFKNCSGLTSAPELPATTLAYYCYQEMFQNCSSLENAPELPAVDLAPYCYNWMFGSCTGLTGAPSTIGTEASILADHCCYMMFDHCNSLEKAPDLPALTLVMTCYAQMFMNCPSLNYIKCLATNPTQGGTGSWVQDVAETGTFVKNPNVSDWPQAYGNYEGIPYGWTVQDAE